MNRNSFLLSGCIYNSYIAKLSLCAGLHQVLKMYIPQLRIKQLPLMEYEEIDDEIEMTKAYETIPTEKNLEYESAVTPSMKVEEGDDGRWR